MGVLLPAQDHFANRIAIQLAPSLTNTFGGRMHVGEKYRPIKSDGAEEGLTDLQSFFPHHFAVDSSMATSD